MATSAQPHLGAGAPQPGSPEIGTFAQTVDRWIYVGMAVWFIVSALAGFIPSSIGKVMAVQQGFRPSFPIVLHVHAVLMGSWLLLLLAQTTLMATGRRNGHMQLGLAGAVLMPAILVTGFILVPTIFHQNWAMLANAPPAALPWGLEGTKNFLSSIVAAQLMVGVLFPLFVIWALKVRRTDAGMHKRLMILATALPLPAGIDRIMWLPSSYPESALSPIGWTVAWVLPMFLWDLYRLKRVHRAYIVWFGIFAPVAILVYNLWGSPGWITLVQRVMGVA